MTENEALALMVPPGQRRPGKPNGGVIQILVTSSCNLACFACTQASNLRRKPWFMTPEQFEQAVLSLRGYFGTVGVFGGCPTIHPQFETLCEILRRHVPKEKCGLWANHPMGKGAACRITFNPAVSNLNVHLDRDAYDEFRRDWPECRPFGLDRDSRHSPPFVAMRDVVRKDCERCGGLGQVWRKSPTSGVLDNCGICSECEGAGNVPDEGRIWELASGCDINKHWSALIGVFRGELRAWFCEIAGAQAILHQDEPDYPDTGYRLEVGRQWLKDRGAWEDIQWWQLPMQAFAQQVRKHCFDCGVPLRGYGELAQADRDPGETIVGGMYLTEGRNKPLPREQVSATHASVYQPKRKDRPVEVVTQLYQLGMGRIQRSTDYLGNAVR